MNEFLQSILAWSANSPYWLGTAIFVAAFLECLALVGIVLPGVVLMFGLAVMAGSSSLGLPSVLLLAWVGALCGDFLSYALGNRLQRRVPRLPLLRTHPHWLVNAEVHFERYGALSLLVGRFVGPLRPVLPLVAGMLSMPLGRFVSVSLFASAGWSVAYVMPGWLVGAAFDLTPPQGFWVQAGWIAGSISLAALLSIVSCLRNWRMSSLVSAAVSIIALIALMLNWQHFVLFDSYIHELSQLLRTPWLDHSMIIITRLADFETQFLVSALLCALLLVFRQYRALLFAGGALFAAAATNQLLKPFFARARPDVLLEPLQSYSFPSSHSVSGFAFFLVLGVLASRQQPQRWRVLWLLTALLPAFAVALSRVYLTAHWPTDILAGAMLGSAVCALSLLLVQARKPIPALKKLHWQIIIPALLLALTFLVLWNLPQALQKYAY